MHCSVRPSLLCRLLYDPMLGLRAIGLSVLFAFFVGQNPVPDPKLDVHFDAVSIRENRSNAEQGGMDIPPASGRITVTNARMSRIIAFAYNRSRNDLIEGLPDWASNERWDIQAKIADEYLPVFKQMTFEQKKMLLQDVLKDRCNMRAHLGRKEVPVYALVIAKGGPKLLEVSTSESEAASPVWNIQVNRGEIKAHEVPIAALLYALSGISLDRQVVDKTGLTALYNFDLKWTPDDISQGGDSGQTAIQEPSLFTAIQEQLGLRLQPIKADVDAVIVEHIERPSPN